VKGRKVAGELGVRGKRRKVRGRTARNKSRTRLSGNRGRIFRRARVKDDTDGLFVGLIVSVPTSIGGSTLGKKMGGSAQAFLDTDRRKTRGSRNWAIIKASSPVHQGYVAVSGRKGKK